MDVFNLVVRFRMAGDTEFQTAGASRIRIDGQGLVVYDCENHARNIDVNQLGAFSILPVNRPGLIPASVQ